MKITEYSYGEIDLPTPVTQTWISLKLLKSTGTELGRDREGTNTMEVYSLAKKGYYQLLVKGKKYFIIVKQIDEKKR